MPVNMNLAALYMNENGEYKPIPGVRGEPGVTPTISVEDIPGGHRVTIAGADGSTSIDVMDGTNGVSPTVAVTDVTGGHRVTITDATGTRSFDVLDGATGATGAPGAAGVSPTVAVTDITGGHRVTITDATGSSSFDVMDGATGTPGAPGAAGVSPTVAVTDITGGHRVTITDATGSSSFDVMDGVGGSMFIQITGQPGSLVADKTFAEAYQAYQDGIMLYAVRSGELYGLISVSPSASLGFKNFSVINDISAATATLTYRSDGTITASRAFLTKVPPLILPLYCDDSSDYMDPPSGTLSIGYYGDITDINFALTDRNVILINGEVTDLSTGDKYDLVSTSYSSGDPGTLTITFRCLGMRNGVPIVKTINLSGEVYSGQIAVAYSETALAVAP